MSSIVIIDCFYSSGQRTDLLQSFFLNRGDTVTVIASNFKHREKTFRNEEKDGFVFLPVKPYEKNLSFSRMFSHKDFAKKAFDKVEEYNPDIVWILVPPNSLVKEAAKYKKKHKNVKLIADIIDMWPETMPIGSLKKIPPFTMWKNIRDKNINMADTVVTECNLYQTVLRKKCAESKLKTIYLAKGGTAEFTDITPPENRYSLCYLGSINNIIDIPAICSIIKDLPEREERPILHIIGDGESRDLLIEQTKVAGAEVVYHGKIYDMTEKQKIFDNCHFGLNVMKPTVFVGLTMKSIDYFYNGLPIINTIKGDTWGLVDEHKIGVNYSEDKEQFQNEVNTYKTDRIEVRQFFDNYLSIDSFFENVEKVINSL